jgi:hypothetical protein
MESTLGLENMAQNELEEKLLEFVNNKDISIPPVQLFEPEMQGT